MSRKSLRRQKNELFPSKQSHCSERFKGGAREERLQLDDR